MALAEMGRDDLIMESVMAMARAGTPESLGAGWALLKSARSRFSRSGGGRKGHADVAEGPVGQEIWRRN